MKLSWIMLFAVMIALSLPAPALAQNTSPAPAQETAAPSLADENIPEEYLVEAEQFFDECEISPAMNKYYNCECLAAQFLDERISVGPGLDRTAIIQMIGKGCADATNAAGSYYQMCLGSGSLLPENIPVETYCGCYANEFAKIFESSGVRPSSRAFVQIQTTAHMRCRTRFQ